MQNLLTSPRLPRYISLNTPASRRSAPGTSARETRTGIRVSTIYFPPAERQEKMHPPRRQCRKKLVDRSPPRPDKRNHAPPGREGIREQGKEQIIMNVNICQPGHGASCALCCGSHNYRACKEEIDELFRWRGHIARDLPGSGKTDDIPALVEELQERLLKRSIPRLYEDALQCPFVARLDPAGNVGCLIYSIGGQEHVLTGGTCRIYSCPAAQLDENRILYAARLAGDWYRYGLLIHNRPVLDELMARHPEPSAAGPGELEELEKRLAVFLHGGEGITGISPAARKFLDVRD